MRTYDPNDTAASISAFVNELARKVNRSSGYFDRFDAAIGAGETFAAGDLGPLQMAGNARDLRRIADAMDERRHALTGQVPRLRLVAAE